MLESKGIPYRYREYTAEPLSSEELREVFKMLGVGPQALLRKNDKAYKANGLTGAEPDEQLIALMAEHPTLLQRPIGVLNGQAAVGRPPENLLTIV